MAIAANVHEPGDQKASPIDPQIRDYFTDEEVKALVEMIKTHMVDNIALLRSAAEQKF
jgi:hypothetical protein